MDFREEYKNSAEIMGPSEEAMMRMKKNIMKQIEKAPAKKAFPFRTAAAVCGGLAACAAVAVVCVNVIPRLNPHTDITAASSVAAAVDVHENEKGVQENAAETPVSDAAVGAKDMEEEVNYAASTTTAVMNGIADSSADIPFDILTGDDMSANDCDYAEDAVNDAVADNCFTDMDIADETPTGTIDSVIQDSGASFGEEAEMMLFKLSEDMGELFIGDRIYVLTDDGLMPPSAEIVSENHFAPDGTEYRLDRYGDDYIVLSRDNGSGSFEIIGGYKMSE